MRSRRCRWFAGSCCFLTAHGFFVPVEAIDEPMPVDANRRSLAPFGASLEDLEYLSIAANELVVETSTQGECHLGRRHGLDVTIDGTLDGKNAVAVSTLCHALLAPVLECLDDGVGHVGGRSHDGSKILVQGTFDVGSNGRISGDLADDLVVAGQEVLDVWLHGFGVGARGFLIGGSGGGRCCRGAPCRGLGRGLVIIVTRAGG